MKEFIDKLISRLEEELSPEKECFEYEDDYIYAEERYNKMLKIVKELAEEYKSGWTACSERLPENDECIIRVDGVEFCKHILTTTNDVDSPICVGWYDREEETWFDLEGFAFYPIAWQPLPAPYQPKGE